MSLDSLLHGLLTIDIAVAGNVGAPVVIVSVAGDVVVAEGVVVVAWDDMVVA